MCQMCEEADAYRAQLEAAAKKRAEAQRKAETPAGERESRIQEGRAEGAFGLGS